MKVHCYSTIKVASFAQQLLVFSAREVRLAFKALACGRRVVVKAIVSFDGEKPFNRLRNRVTLIFSLGRAWGLADGTFG